MGTGQFIFVVSTIYYVLRYYYHLLPVVPHKAVAEISKIGNL